MESTQSASELKTMPVLQILVALEFKIVSYLQFYIFMLLRIELNILKLLCLLDVTYAIHAMHGACVHPARSVSVDRHQVPPYNIETTQIIHNRNTSRSHKLNIRFIDVIVFKTISTHSASTTKESYTQCCERMYANRNSSSLTIAGIN